MGLVPRRSALTPNLSLEEPPAQTSAKEPWVSDGFRASWGVLSVRLWVEEMRDNLWLLSLPKQLGNFYLQKLHGISWPQGAIFLPSAPCWGTQMRPPVSPAQG